jgi:hypothetical protein
VYGFELLAEDGGVAVYGGGWWMVDDGVSLWWSVVVVGGLCANLAVNEPCNNTSTQILSCYAKRLIIEVRHRS